MEPQLEEVLSLGKADKWVTKPISVFLKLQNFDTKGASYLFEGFRDSARCFRQHVHWERICDHCRR